MAVLDRTADRVPDDQFPVACDVSRSDEVASAVASVVEHFGSLDIVINDAGIGAAGDITANDDDEWHRVLDVNIVPWPASAAPRSRTCAGPPDGDVTR